MHREACRLSLLSGLQLITRWVIKGWVSDCALPLRRVDELAARRRDLEQTIETAVA